MSKTCGLAKPHRAFIPFANIYQLGLLADQYERPTKIGKSRVWLLVLSIIGFIITVVYEVGAFGFMIDMFENIQTMFNSMDTMDTIPQDVLENNLIFSAVSMLYSFIVLPYAILKYIALYKIYKMTDSKNAVLFIILSIFVGASSVLLFILRKKPIVFKNQPPYNPNQGYYYNNGNYSN